MNYILLHSIKNIAESPSKEAEQSFVLYIESLYCYIVFYSQVSCSFLFDLLIYLKRKEKG